MMNVHALFCLAVCAAPALVAPAAATAPGAPDWENLAVNSRNRLPPRTYSMPLADERAALTDALEPETPYRQSLNGRWKISWSGNPQLAVKGFERPDFDDSAWYEIDVPSCVEMRGFGSPGYVNVKYPHANKWPRILDRDTEQPDYNPVSCYRTVFTVPESWAGRDVILRFDGVYSAYSVWVNGKEVGYAEDSKLPSEFDVTSCLRPGTNLLAVKVFRWCDGSYLEDQDMFRFSGIFRDVTLWAKPKDGIWDFAVRTTPVDGCERWRLEVEVDGGEAVSLYDADKKKVCDLHSTPTPNIYASTLAARAWSAETPYLYTLVIRKGGDIRMKRVGFKNQRIVGNTFLVNGKPVKFKGVNRHESSPDNGRTVTLDDMVRDVTLMKRYNFNTVRTSHYPDHHSWYDLCDRYGLYLVAEANVEGHEPGYGEDGLGRFPEWDHTIVERNERHVRFYRNHPSVTMWSMGNETGHGDCFRHAIAAVKAIDPTRPVHWERGNADADIDSSMYPSVEWLEARGKLGDAKDGALVGESGGEGFAKSTQTPGKAYFICEYAHAMGNAMGNFAEYWDVIYAHPSIAGGCVWDWIDQAIWKETGYVDPKTGRPERFLAYGGDHDEEPNNGPFCVNGVIGPTREVTAKLIEAGHVQRNLIVTPSPAGEGDNAFAVIFELRNRFAFTFADEFAGAWKLRENGVVTKTGGFEVPRVAPLAKCRFTVPGVAEALAAAKPGAELLVDFEFSTLKDELWAKKGWIVARDQIALGTGWDFTAARMTDGTAAPKVAEDERTVTVSCGATHAVFCRKSGTLCELAMNGRTILKDPAPGVATGPRFTCFRAFTDNDRWVRDGDPWGENRKEGSFYASGLSQLRYHARPIVVDGDVVKTSVEVTGSKSAGFVHEMEWAFLADGSIEVKNVLVPHGTMPPALPRIGLSWILDRDLERMEYYGRGPRENYVDRCTGSFLGFWTSTVTDQFEPYVRPQDNGYKCDVRHVDFLDKKGRGVRFSASAPLFVQALHCAAEDLEFARQRPGQKRWRTPLPVRKEIYLNLDIRQLGLGGGSCGPRPMAKYMFPIIPEAWTVRLEPR